MKIRILIFLAMITMPLAANAQGFNWQYSPRLPFSYPFLFAGLNGSFNYLYHDAALDMSEGTGDCCNYQIGRGFGTDFGLDAEYWQTWDLAFKMTLNYKVNNGDFIASGESLPFSVFDSEQRVIGHDTAYFENKMTSKLNYFSIKLGGKYRLFGSHFHAGVFVTASYMISSRVIQTESVTRPSYWTYNDGSKERTIADYELSGISKINISPGISFGYDIPLALGMYASPSISIGLPVYNIAESGDWRTWNINLGLSIFNSIMSK